MKFRREYLIGRITEVIAARERATTERNEQDKVRYAERMAQHVAETSEAWKQLADTIRVRVRNGKPMLRDDVPKELRVGLGNGIWSDREPKPLVADTAALTQLLVLLEASVDEYVTTSALESMGFRTASLLS